MTLGHGSAAQPGRVITGFVEAARTHLEREREFGVSLEGVGHTPTVPEALLVGAMRAHMGGSTL